MIWYLLYPFRGTTKPPVLDPQHPLRRAFARHGSYTARHPVNSILISVAIATILIYPFPFLYTNSFTNGASNLPHHVWTAAQPFQGIASTPTDIAMRSIWVHGSFMKALDEHVLQSALVLQDELLGSTTDFDPRRSQDENLRDLSVEDWSRASRDRMHAINGLSNDSWFFHSPLQYWNCSAATIGGDQDIIATVNRGSRQATSVNVTLRHSIVFSGKRFEDHRLVAADALVITLIHKLDSPVGKRWVSRAHNLASRSSKLWRLYPADGKPSSSLYEFRFQPLSFRDDLGLGLAYGLTAVYFIYSLSKIRALKSRIGLAVAVIGQFALSIISSLTVCAIFKIDLSKIPRAAYPLVILACGVENIFRLINSLILAPSDGRPAARMAEALGKTGYIALAAVAQNLTILWMLSKLVSPGISAFCTFVAFALSFDFFYLLTFFVAVLGVDVRRTELTEALNKASARKPSPVRHPTGSTWTDGLLRGEAPISTRIAGTVVMIAFIIVAQWHFLDDVSLIESIWRLALKSGTPPPHDKLTVDVNQARTPTAWLRLQDHETAREVINVIKPHAHSYIARVYDPLVFVLKGSDRTSTSSGVRKYLPAAYDFVRNQLVVFALTVVVVVAVVCLLTNYLLHEEISEEDVDTSGDRDESVLSIKSYSGHTLDIVYLTASNQGITATVGLDRSIQVWNSRIGTWHHVDNIWGELLFPVLAIAMDHEAQWLAILRADGMVLLWDIGNRSWGLSLKVDSQPRSPLAFFFNGVSGKNSGLVLIKEDAWLIELDLGGGVRHERQICKSRLVEAKPCGFSPSPTSFDTTIEIGTTSRSGCFHIVSRSETGWASAGVHPTSDGINLRTSNILPLPELSAFLACYSDTIELIDSSTRKMIRRFATPHLEAKSLQCQFSQRGASTSDAVHLSSLTLAYTRTDSGSCIVRTYDASRRGNAICFFKPKPSGIPTFRAWPDVLEDVHAIDNPGEWRLLQSGYTIGIRKSNGPDGETPLDASTSFPTGLRRRTRLASSPSKIASQFLSPFEIWTVTPGPSFEQAMQPLSKAPETDHLLVSRLGPISVLGKRSIAVAVGNVVKVITVGGKRLGGSNGEEIDGQANGVGLGRKKRHAGTRKRRI